MVATNVRKYTLCPLSKSRPDIATINMSPDTAKGVPTVSKTNVITLLAAVPSKSIYPNLMTVSLIGVDSFIVLEYGASSIISALSLRSMRQMLTLVIASFWAP